AVLQSGTQVHHTAAVMMRGFFDDGDGRQKSLQVEAEVQLGRRFASPVFGPVHAIGNQRNGGRIQAVNRLLKAAGQPLVASGWTEPRKLVLQMVEHFPE